MPTGPIKAVVFDLDGTLVDTFPLIVDAFNFACTPITGKTYSPENVISRFGHPEPVMIRDEVADRWEEAQDSYYRYYEQHHHERVQPFPGVNEMLAEIRTLKILMALVTGKSRKSADITLREMGWSACFASVVTGSEMPRQKPHPDGLLLAAKAMQMAPTSCAMVGDSPADIGAGQAAGMPTIVAAWHCVYLERLKTMGPDRWAKMPAEVVAMLRINPPDRSAVC